MSQTDHVGHRGSGLAKLLLELRDDRLVGLDLLLGTRQLLPEDPGNKGGEGEKGRIRFSGLVGEAQASSVK